MNTDRIASWISIIANIGVFVGFLLVAYQLQLNTKALATTGSHKSSELFSNAEMALMGDTGSSALAKALLHPALISDEELMQVWSYFSLGFLAASQAFEDYQSGVISEERWLFVADLYISYINHPVGLLYWGKR